MSILFLVLAVSQSQPQPLLEIPIHFVQITRSNGKVDIYKDYDHVVSLKEFNERIDLLNEMSFMPNGIKLVPLPDPIKVVADDTLYLVRDPKETGRNYTKGQKPPQYDDGKIYETLASSRNGMCFIGRQGTDWRWDDARGQWYLTPDASRGHERYSCVNGLSAYFWGHELGHTFGLPHTFTIRNSLKSVTDIQAHIDEFVRKNPNRNPILAIDGDLGIGIKDTPPDPGADYWRPGFNEDTVSLRLGNEEGAVRIHKWNIMSSSGKLTLSKDQAELIKATATFWKMNDWQFPRNTVPKNAEIHIATPNSFEVPDGTVIRKAQFGKAANFQPYISISSKVGDRIKMYAKFPAGTYDLYLHASRGLDQGRFLISHSEFSTEMSFWARGQETTRVEPRSETGNIPLGRIRSNGKNSEIFFEVLPPHRMSLGNTLGIQGLVAVPVAG